MAKSVLQKQEPILEYLDYDLGSIRVNPDGEILLGSYNNMWIFPGRTYLVPTGIRFWYPDNSVGFTTGAIWANRFEVIPQIHTDDCEIWIKIKNPGILPKKLHESEMLANLTVIPKMECHIVSKGWS